MTSNEIYFEVKQNRAMKLTEKKSIAKKATAKFIASHKSFHCDVTETSSQLRSSVR